MAKLEPHPVDIHVGARVRARRKSLGLSQHELGAKIGLTFQQVQKYERAANRVSASMLSDIADALQAPIAYFFDGYSKPDQGKPKQAGRRKKAEAVSFTPAEEAELVSTFPLIRNPKQKRRVLELVRTLAEVDD